MSNALILLSGGLDSATCLFLACEEFDSIYTISYQYSQRHEIELNFAQSLAESKNVIEHFVMPINLGLIGKSALTDNINVPKGGADLDKKDFIPTTYVPGRNLVFLAIASSFAESKEIDTLFIGANALDYSGYPDCRPEFFKSFSQTTNLGSKSGNEGLPLKIETPLINMSKAEIVKKANLLAVPFELTWSCYDPQPGPQICGACDSCILRKQGFQEAGVEDYWK